MSDDPVQSPCPSPSVATSSNPSFPPETAQDTEESTFVVETARSSHRVSQVTRMHDESKFAMTVSATTSMSNKLRRVSSRTVDADGKYVNETQGLLEAGLRYANCNSDSESIMAHTSSRRSFSGQAEAHDVDISITLSERLWRSFLQVCYAIALGTLVGLVTVFFHAATSKFEEYHRLGATSVANQISWSANKCLRAVDVFSSCGGIAFGIYMTLGTTLSSFITVWLCQHIVPECIGGGTIATKICLAVGAPIPLRVGIWRLLLSTLYVGSGNALGIEAPTLHVCAAIASSFHHAASCIANCINQCFPESLPMPPLFEKDGLPQAVVLGCAAGLSAAFGSPLAGITYAVEEYVDVRQTGIVTALVLMSCVSATLIRRSFETHTGNGPLSMSSQEARDGNGSSSSVAMPGVDATWMLFAVTISVALGILSPMVMSAVLNVRSFFHGRKNRSCEVLVGTLGGLAAGIIGCIAYILTSCDTAWGFGKLEDIFDMQTMCKLPADATSAQEVGVLLILSFAKLLAFLICFALGGSGGALMPSLFIGGLIGRCIGLAFASVDKAFPHAGTVLGMATLFSANMRLPLTGATVVLEFAMVNESHYDARLVCMIPLAAAFGTWIASMSDALSVHERMMLQDGIDPLTLCEQIELMMKGKDNLESVDENTGVRLRSGSVVSCESRASRLSLSGVVNNVDTSASSMRMLAVARRRSVMPETRGILSSRSSSAIDGTRSIISAPEDLLHASNFRVPLKQARFERFFPRATATLKKVHGSVARKNSSSAELFRTSATGRHASKNSMGSCKMDRGSILSCLPEDQGTHVESRDLQIDVGSKTGFPTHSREPSSASSFGKGRSSVVPSCSGLFASPGRHLSHLSHFSGSTCPSNASFFSTTSPQRASMGVSPDLQAHVPNPRLLGRGHAKARREEEELSKKRLSVGNRFMCFFRDPFTRSSSICKVEGFSISGGNEAVASAQEVAEAQEPSSSTEVLS